MKYGVQKPVLNYIGICRIIENYIEEWVQIDYILIKIATYS